MRPKKQSDSEKYPEVPDPNHTNDLGRRIASLESSIIEIRKSHLEGHKWFTTVMFTLVAVLLTVLGTVSKTDVRDAIRDMKSESRDSTKDMQATVDFAVSDMDRKFQALSGEALKRPMLRIFTPNGPLDGKVYEVRNGSAFPPEPLFLANDGDKSTEPLSIRFFSTAEFSSAGFALQSIRSADKDFPVAYYLEMAEISRRGLGITISAKETWTLENSLGCSFNPMNTNLINCKMQVFYGADKPLETRFIVKLIN